MIHLGFLDVIRINSIRVSLEVVVRPRRSVLIRFEGLAVGSGVPVVIRTKPPDVEESIPGVVAFDCSCDSYIVVVTLRVAVDDLVTVCIKEGPILVKV